MNDHAVSPDRLAPSNDFVPATRESVLIPTGPEMKSYGCIRSLNQRGIHTIVAAESPDVPHFDSRYCAERALLPPFREDLLAYRDALLDLATRSDVETIVPVRECDVYLFAKYREEFDQHVSLVSPDLETLRRSHDRHNLAREAEAAAVPRAKTWSLSEYDAWDRDVVVKARYNILTSEYVDHYSPATAREVHDVLFFPAGESPDEDALRERMDHDPIVQEYVSRADKHLYTALWEDGEPLSTYQHKQLRTRSWVGGAGIYRASAYAEEVEESAYRLLSQMDWDGYACIEYVKDARTGEWKFLENNPRVWQSLPEAVRVGVDFPYHYWLAARGSPELIDDRYETGIRSHVSYGELKHLLSIRYDDCPFEEPPSLSRTFVDVVTSCLRDPRFDFIRLDDPRFFLSAVRSLPGIAFGDRYERSEVPQGSSDVATRRSPAAEPVGETH